MTGAVGLEQNSSPAPLSAAPEHVAEQPAPAAPGPQRTSATYADWVMECGPRAGSPAQKSCGMLQTTHVQGKGAIFSRIMIVPRATGEPFQLVVQVPADVSFKTRVHIQIDNADAGIEAPFTSCVQIGCYAEFPLKEDILTKFRAASGIGKVTFADSASRPIAVPLSFKGFDGAFDALTKQ